MAFLSTLPRGVRRLFRLPQSRERLLQEMDEEIQAHLAMRVEELRRHGMSESEARAEALRRFGDSSDFDAHVTRRAARQVRRQSIREWLEGWAYDIRFALRQFRSTRAVTALAVLTLALGIGANAAIFTVVHRLLLAPLPYPDGNRIVMLTLEADGRIMAPDAQTLRLWRERSRSLEAIGAVTVDAVMVQYDDGQDTVHAYATPSYLHVLGVKPLFGRAFTEDEARADATVALISRSRWTHEFDGAARALGAKIDVDGRPYTVIGVAPDMAPPMSPGSFNKNLHIATPGVWLPMNLDAPKDDGAPESYARLRAGVSAEEASRELQSILNDVPAAKTRPRVRAMRAQDFLDTRETLMVRVLFAAVGVLLLIACANVANLLMSRAWTRRREFAVRVALGAGRARLVRQVLTESVLLALAGGVLGIAVAWQALHLIIALRPPSLDHLAGARVETAVLLWSGAISIATGILFGSGPALFAGARGVGDILQSEARTGSGSVASRRMRSSLIVLEIALSVVLLVGAGLLVRSFAALQRTRLGFEPRGLVSFFVIRGGPREQRAAARDAILQQLRAVPGVTEATFGDMPGEAFGARAPLVTDSGPSGARSVPAFIASRIGPSYFRVAHIALLEGRIPDSNAVLPPGPTPGSVSVPQEIVINRSLARRLWPNGSAIGARLHSPNGPRTDTYTVVGIVDDVRMPGNGDPARAAQVYQLVRRNGPGGSFIVRSGMPSAVLVPALRKAVTTADSRTFVQTMTVGERFLRDALAPTTFAMALLMTFALVALALSAVGLFGVIAYSVTQRTREIGVRVALGANPSAVARLVIGAGLQLSLIGVGTGVVGAFIGTRMLASLLYGVQPGDAATFGAVGALVLAIALLASWLPARRALRIDPIDALRAN